MKNLGVVILAVLLFVACSGSKEQKEQTPPQEINELPHLIFTTLTGQPASTRNLSTPLVLILFFADCDHCQREAQDIQKNLDLFKDKTIQFISASELTEIQQFAADYGLSNQPNVHFGRTEVTEVHKNFGSVPTPAIYLYSADKRLIKSFKGETPVAEIAEAFK